MSTGFYRSGYAELYGLVVHMKQSWYPRSVIDAHVRCAWNHAESHGRAEAERCHRESNPDNCTVEYLASTFKAGMVAACQDYFANNGRFPEHPYDWTDEEVAKRIPVPQQYGA